MKLQKGKQNWKRLETFLKKNGEYSSKRDETGGLKNSRKRDLEDIEFRMSLTCSEIEEVQDIYYFDSHLQVLESFQGWFDSANWTQFTTTFNNFFNCIGLWTNLTNEFDLVISFVGQKISFVGRKRKIYT